MLIITIRRMTGKVDLEWHVGEPVPRIGYAEDVTINADGDELAYIAERILGIPMRRGARVVTWGEPWARFILENLAV